MINDRSVPTFLRLANTRNTHQNVKKLIVFCLKFIISHLKDISLNYERKLLSPCETTSSAQEREKQNMMEREDSYPLSHYVTNMREMKTWQVPSGDERNGWKKNEGIEKWSEM